jgi:hypothetical protein
MKYFNCSGIFFLLFLGATLIAKSQTVGIDAVKQTVADCAISETNDRQQNFCYIASEITMLREQASLETAPHARFPIGTRVRILDREGDWIRVYAYGRKNDEQGWMYLKDVQKLEPSLESIVLQFKSLPVSNIAARRQLAEQAIALAPFAAEAHQLLFDINRKAGDSNAHKQVQDHYQELISQDVKKLPGEQTLIFAVDNGMLSPFAALGKNGLIAVEQQKNDALPNAEQKEPSYFRSGRVLNFYQRGIFTGKLRVKHIEKIPCELDTAGALDIKGKTLDDHIIGLASNQVLVQPKSNQAMAMNDKQNAIMNMLLGRALKAHGLKKQKTTKLLQLIQSSDQGYSVQRFAFNSGKEKREWLLTSFEASMEEDNPANTVIYYGFLIAEKTSANSYRTMHSDIKHTSTGENWSLRFLDYLDLDQDGVNDLIFIRYGLEYWLYEAWSLKSKQWKRIVLGGGGSC